MARANVFLDLDNTLLSAVPITEIKWDEPTLDLATEFPFHNMEDYYLVFERPGLQDFLDFLFKTFNVSVWSAATKDYVLFIVDKILQQRPGRKVNYIFFSYHCDKCKKDRKGSVKLLDFLWDRYKLQGITPENTFIIDDNDRVAAFNPNNVVHIKEFEFEDGPECKDDTELGALQKRLQALADDFAVANKLNLDILSTAHSAPQDRREYALSYLGRAGGSDTDTESDEQSDDSTDEDDESTDESEGHEDGDEEGDEEDSKLNLSGVVDDDSAVDSKTNTSIRDDDIADDAAEGGGDEDARQ